LVVVGNGMAGMRTVEELCTLAPDRYAITVLGKEPHPNYNRILLSPVLAGEQTIAEIVIHPRAWYDEHGVTLVAGDEGVRIDRIRRVVVTRSGAEHPYDRLLVATGSAPVVLPLPGKDLPGVLTYRDIADTEAMIDAAKRYSRAVVIGGGCSASRPPTACARAAWT
jgi:nitrite reductase (NADH) large subunit